MKIAIVGSREWPDPERIEEWVDGFCDGFANDDTLISGGAPGVDTWAQRAFERRGLPVRIVRPQWRRPDGSYNPRAGFERNKQIVLEADRVAVIWNGASAGSKNDIDLALQHGRNLEVIFP